LSLIKEDTEIEERKIENNISEEIISEKIISEDVTTEQFESHVPIPVDKYRNFLFFDASERHVTATNQEAVIRAAKDIKNNKVLAIKDHGGFHLVCSPYSRDAIAELRRVTRKEKDPLYLMFDNVRSLSRIFLMSSLENEIITCAAEPIVMLKLKLRPFPLNLFDGLYCGCSIANTQTRGALCVEAGVFAYTEAIEYDNLIIYQDLEMIRFANEHKISVLSQDWVIPFPIEDSIIKCIENKPILIRRARGFAMEPIKLPKNDLIKEISVLAMGGDMSNTFCARQNNKYTVSQTLGDLSHQRVYETVKDILRDYRETNRFQPDVIACDAHPGYYSGDLAREISQQTNTPVKYVQHHHAHVASVMSEHSLDEAIGVAFDGGGCGGDGQIWGGEFLICKGGEYTRAGHLAYTKTIGDINGVRKSEPHDSSDTSISSHTITYDKTFDKSFDRLNNKLFKTRNINIQSRIKKNAQNIPIVPESSRDARKTAFFHLVEAGLYNENTKLAMALKNNIGTINTSSITRLFDTAACLLELENYNHFDGQCAQSLERAAELAINSSLARIEMDFDISETLEPDYMCIVGFIGILRTLLSKIEPYDIIHGKITNWYSLDYRRALALGFHHAVAKMINSVCKRLREREEINNVCLAGSVFQNKILTEMTYKLLVESGFYVFRNELFPPNDASLSVGQAYVVSQKNSRDDLKNSDFMIE
jgi:hydrogenase maturation protein HypF